MALIADTSLALHQQIEAERQAAQPQASMLKVFRSYAKGRQRGTLTPGQQRILRGLLAHAFADNVCRMILTALSGRLILQRFAVEGADKEAAPAKLIEDYLRQIWTLNKVAALAQMTHTAALRDGNHAIALAVDPDTRRIQIARELWWNGESGIFVGYGDDGTPSYALKDWTQRGKKRRTVWTADTISRFIQQGNGWEPYRLPDDGPMWPVPWVSNGQPLGIPVVHFSCTLMPADGDDPAKDAPPEYGMSVLDGGLLGLQDEINDVHRDIVAGARFTAYQMYYGTGVKSRTDPISGRKLPFIVEPGAFFEAEDPDARFGTLPPGSLVELERTLAVKLQAVGRLTGVPQHLIGGQWPSGEALLRAERPLIDAAETLARSIGPAWSSVAHKATVLANAFAGQQLDPNLLISSVFAPADRSDALMNAQVAAARAPYVSEREVLRLLGYSPDQQDRILDERAAEAATRAAAAPVVVPTTNQGGA